MSRRITYTKMTVRAADVDPGDYIDGSMVITRHASVVFNDVTLFGKLCKWGFSYNELVEIVRSSELGPDTLPKDLLENLLTHDQVVC